MLRIIVLLCLTISASGAQSKPKVYLFMLEDCVISQSYTPALNQLYDQFQGDFDFFLVFPNERSKQASIEAFLKKYSLNIPYKTDHYKALSRQLGASVTPEVVIVSEDGAILYKGAIDDGYAGIGKKRKAQKMYLHQALAAIVQNKQPDPATTQAFGCFINFNENSSIHD